MKKIGVVLLSVVAVVFPAFGERFLSVSDVHFDPFADPSLVAKLEGADVAQWEAILATSTQTAFSTYGHDLNEPLFRSALGEMQKQIPAPAFVLISGDFLAHGFEKSYQQYATDKSQAAYTAFVTKTIAYVAGAFRKIYPNVPIYPTLGNNDSDCGDYAVVPNGKFLANFRDVWSPIVRSRSFDRRFPAGGYYHADVRSLENVRIIAINTNFFSTNYKNPCGQPGPDPGVRELVWLDDELRLAKDLGRQVWLLFHIPPGMDVFDTVQYGGACPSVKSQTFWKDEYQQEYLRITKKHRHTIAGSFAGHTHQDEFRLSNGDFIHITPSVTPIFGNNPAFEIVDVERNGEISGYKAWHLPNVTVPWQYEYSFDEAYGKKRYDAKSLMELEASVGNDDATREEYFTHSSSGNPKTTAAALAAWKAYWCGLTVMEATGFGGCYCGAAQ
jgi:sphingomyelin phosphodiesterase acid-like 3